MERQDPPNPVDLAASQQRYQGSESDRRLLQILRDALHFVGDDTNLSRQVDQGCQPPGTMSHGVGKEKVKGNRPTNRTKTSRNT